MAAEQDLTLDDTSENNDAATGGKKKLLLLIVVGVVLVAIAVGVTLFLVTGDNSDSADEEQVEEVVAEEPKIPAQYLVLKPEFVVSFQVGSRQRFLQASIEIMTRTQSVVDALTLHEPMVRNDIIRIIGEQDFKQLRTAEGRVALQQQLLEHLRTIMQREAGADDVEAVLFTNFVMQ